MNPLPRRFLQHGDVITEETLAVGKVFQALPDGDEIIHVQVLGNGDLRGKVDVGLYDVLEDFANGVFMDDLQVNRPVAATGKKIQVFDVHVKRIDH